MHRRPRIAVALAAALTAACLTVAPASGAAASAAVPRSGSGPSAATDGHVWSVRPQADGSVAYTAYRPAPGVSAARLYRLLAAQGVPGLLDPATAATPLTVACAYGTAYAFNGGMCPPARWRWNGYSDPQVYFRDHTPAAWPVRASVTEWNRAVGVDSYWTTGPCPTSGRHCVHVWSGNYGTTGWTGNTSYRLDSSRFFIDGSVWVELNDYYAASTVDRRNTACHELGHALGVGHNLADASCMYATDVPSNPQYPHSSDYNLLRYVLYP